jgi:renalase
MARSDPSFSVAVIGAGIAGASCARALASRGCAVHVVDKSRGVGGRLATRRLSWRDAEGREHVAKIDHGAPAFAARSAAFQAFLATVAQPHTLAKWAPDLAPNSRPLDDSQALWLPQPDMPALCRDLLRDIPTTLAFTVDRLLRRPRGWQVEAAGSTLDGPFDAVVLALPLPQAAPLLAPHRSDWAQRASLALMQPCWTLMGVARRPTQTLTWTVARPQGGPLSWVMRSNARPGRETPSDATQWVAHARTGWSRQHLEHDADAVQAEMQAQLQAALQAELGEPIDWQHAVVHRWRYAMAQPQNNVAPSLPCWWDTARGLGVCGDVLGSTGATGRTGVEDAWRSAQALAHAMQA